MEKDGDANLTERKKKGLEVVKETEQMTLLYYKYYNAINFPSVGVVLFPNVKREIRKVKLTCVG